MQGPSPGGSMAGTNSNDGDSRDLRLLLCGHGLLLLLQLLDCCYQHLDMLRKDCELVLLVDRWWRWWSLSGSTS